MAKYESIAQAAIDFLAQSSYPGYDGELRKAVEAKYPGAIERARVRHKKARDAARFVGNPPTFVRTYVRKYAPKIHRVTWRRSRMSNLSSGQYDPYDSAIVVTAGADEIDQRVTLLHEIAHFRTPYEKHGDKFYDQWYRLLKGEGLYRAGANRFHGRLLKSAARRARARKC
jgi:hypothetical protein